MMQQVKIDDVLTEPFLLFEFFCWRTHPSCLKVMGWGGARVYVVTHETLVSAQGPLVLVFFGFGAKGLGRGLNNSGLVPVESGS